MKWRNQFLALLCLAGFVGLGILYFRNWVVQKPFGIILFIGEGLTSQRVAATRVYRGGADNPLTIDRLEFSARLRNYSADFAVPDAGAAASAIATGARAKNGSISLDQTGAPRKTILEIAHEAGRATGIVSDGALTNPAVAAFYTHAASTKQQGKFAAALTRSETIDVALGGGAADFASVEKGIKMQVIKNSSELEEISLWQHPRVLGLFANDDLPFADEIAAGTSDKPSLGDMVRRAIELLQQNRRGYVLVVDARLMATAAFQNQGERTLRQTAELDHAIQVAREYAGRNSAILVTGDAGIGGMSVNGFPFRYDSGVAILGLNSLGEPWITWATGPNGEKNSDATAATKNPEPAAVAAAAALNTVDDPIASAAGLRMERVRGTLESTQLFGILRDAL